MIVHDLLFVTTTFLAITYIPLSFGKLLGNLSVYLYDKESNNGKEAYRWKQQELLERLTS